MKVRETGSQRGSVYLLHKIFNTVSCLRVRSFSAPFFMLFFFFMKLKFSLDPLMSLQFQISNAVQSQVLGLVLVY